jgi:hypothetical protein
MTKIKVMKMNIIIATAILLSLSYTAPGQAVTEYPPDRSVTDSAMHPNGDSTFMASSCPPKNDTVRHLYRVNYWVSSIFSAVASAADLYAINGVLKSKVKITPLEIQSLNTNVFSSLDRWALNLDPSQRGNYLKAADYMLPVIIITPGLLGLNKNIRKDWGRILLMYYEMQCITFSIYNFSPFGPAFQNKYRPVVYYQELTDNVRMVGNNRNSMYSGHAATALASTFFMVKVYCDYNPDISNGKKYLLYTIATIPALTMGYLRVEGLEHFPTDILVGLIIGGTCGILVPEIHRFKNHKVIFGVSSSSTGGAGLNMVWNMDAK